MSALDFSSCQSVHTTGVWIHTAATNSTTLHLALDPEIKLLTFLCFSTFAPPTYLDPTASCALRRDCDHAVHAVSAPMVEYDAALMMVHRAHAAVAPVVEYDAASTETQQLQAIEKIVDIPEIQTLEAVLHEFDDEESCCDDFEKICYMTRMNRNSLVETCLAWLLISFGFVKI